ncbi:hypothetical protein F4861DRAFT_492555 [Xylaria intraflava]|nr:hypothetical protein F4861DRAFT_492555 [Xylaria intraflava]
MFNPRNPLVRVILLILAFNVYASYHDQPLGPRSMVYPGCAADQCTTVFARARFLNMPTLIEIYIAAEIATLFIRPFWVFAVRGWDFARLVHDIVVCWTVAYAFFVFHWEFAYRFGSNGV